MINIPVVVVPDVTRSAVIYSACIVFIEFSEKQQIIDNGTPAYGRNNVIYV